VHWLSPWDEDRLTWVLQRAAYARQINDAQAILVGYGYDVDYPGHKNIEWLSGHVENFFYIDRIIVDSSAQGKGYGRLLYEDFERVALSKGYTNLACEVNIKPDNPGSHRFHLNMGFKAIGEQAYTDYDAAVRYYAKAI